MKNIILCFFWSFSFLSLQAENPAGKDELTFGNFGTVSLYRPDGEIKSIALFISGDGGWNKGVVGMANALVKKNALVVGIDIVKYLKKAQACKENCIYPAAEFEALSQFVQQQLKMPTYRNPILVGYSSGATLVYALLSQAPAGTFAGGLSLGFCPDLEMKKQLCRGDNLACTQLPKKNGWWLTANPKLATPWIILNGPKDKVCNFEDTKKFLEDVPNATLIELPEVGHGFSVERKWMPQFQKAYDSLQNRAAAAGAVKGKAQSQKMNYHIAQDIQDFPLTITQAKKGESEAMAIIISGDGGWTDFDQSIADGFSAAGIPVAGLSSLKYFWDTRTPESAAGDLSKMIRYFRTEWKKDNIILVGYSFGADVLPFMLNRLPATEQAMVKSIVLLSPSPKAEFEFHFASWMNSVSAGARPTYPELEKLQDRHVLCIFGGEEDPSFVRPLSNPNFRIQILRGGHHYGGDTAALNKVIGGFVGQ